VICPVDALVFPIQREANSIICHYALMRMVDFQQNNLPDIEPPLESPGMGVAVQWATVALSKIPERIQRPPENYPILSSLRPGSYICQIWGNAVVVIALFKP
jgi:hypothetical protein